eukprot:5487566-Amphidinium_carterae.1
MWLHIAANLFKYPGNEFGLCPEGSLGSLVEVVMRYLLSWPKQRLCLWKGESPSPADTAKVPAG